MNPADWLCCTNANRMLENLTSLPVQPSHRKLRLFAVACCRSRIQGFNSEGMRWILQVEKQAESNQTLLNPDQEMLDTAAEGLPGRGSGNCYTRAAYSLWIFSPLAAAMGVVTHLSSQERHRHERPRQALLLKVVLGDPWSPVVTERAYHTQAVSRAHVNSCVNFRKPRDREERELFTLQHIFRDSWLTWNEGVVVRLAQTAYEERLPDGFIDPARMCILADAMEEAGCDLPDVLNHSRGKTRCLKRRMVVGEGFAFIDPHEVEVCDTCQNTGFFSCHTPFCRGDWVLDIILGKN